MQQKYSIRHDKQVYIQLFIVFFSMSKLQFKNNCLSKLVIRLFFINFVEKNNRHDRQGHFIPNR